MIATNDFLRLRSQYLPAPSNTPFTPPLSAAPQFGPAQLAAVEHLLSRLQPLEPLDEDDYMTEFWEKGEWERQVKIRKESKDPSDKGGIKGEGINSSWMEDEYGIRVSVERQTEIIAAARRTWVTLSNCGIAVTKFRNAEEIVVSYFRRKLETDFIELRYCHNHWKADRLWQENFRPGVALQLIQR